ncbi:hypothetical protein D0B88_08770 [Cellvibrio sp. KY-YJ-3]|nr:hypothetical protein D0B88_08770 [Cellvibrio sp. KY-YJ-3]
MLGFFIECSFKSFFVPTFCPHAASDLFANSELFIDRKLPLIYLSFMVSKGEKISPSPEFDVLELAESLLSTNYPPKQR